MQKNLLLLFVLAVLFSGCSQKKTELLWDKSFYRIGSQSSPRATDLNGDGILDIVMGTGLGETDSTDQGVIALDGTTGDLLWQQSSSAMIVGSATFLDITQDGTDDIVIGGRNQNLMALDGKTGDKIWSYQYEFEDYPILQYARYNFYNTVLLPDQNQDGLDELLVVNGGNWDALPGSTEDRYPGVLMIMDSKNGTIIAADTMPDGQESYMTPIAFSQAKTGEHHLLFGSGGETSGGHLYEISLSAFMEKGLEEARIIAREQGHGFIAPPVVVDVNLDGWLDIVAISHASTILAISGQSYQVLWEKRFAGLESSNALAVGQFTRDDTPDVMAYVCKGIWPDYTGTYQMMLDGKTGEILWKDSLGCGGLSSPVVYDLDGDGVEEAILSINEFDCSKGYIPALDADPFTVSNRMVYIDFSRRTVQQIDQTSKFKNVFSTPWIGDMDQDGYLDIVYPQYLNQDNLLQFLGMRVKRISTHIRMREEPMWGGYLGSHGDGIAR